MAKSLKYWATKWDNSKKQDAAWKALDLLAEYAGFFKHRPIRHKPVAWGGSLGRFFSGRWNTHHGNEVQNAIANYFDEKGQYKLNKEFHTVEFILALVKKKMSNKKMDMTGDLAKILQVVKNKTQVDYAHLNIDLNKAAILVDVDKTLLGSPPILERRGIKPDDLFNQAVQATCKWNLINALKKRGIKRISLFTSMSLEDISAKAADPYCHVSRQDLIGVLAQNGIEVVAVLTPADVNYNQGPGAAFRDFYKAQYARIGQLSKMTEIERNQDVEFKDYKERYDVLHKAAGDGATGNETEKSKLYQYFLANMGNEIEGCVLIDDQSHHLEAIQAVNKKENKALSVIHVKRGSSQNYFETALLAALNLSPVDSIEQEKRFTKKG